MRPTLLALSATLAVTVPAAAQPFAYTITQPASSLSYNLGISAPFQISPAGSSYIVGTAAGADAVVGTPDDVASPPGSRTVPGLFGGNTAANTPINLTTGSVGASGSSGTNVIRPSGSFRIDFDTTALTCQVSSLSSNLLGGSTATIEASATIGYSSFRTREPSCTLISLGPITVPLGQIAANAITAAQTGGGAGVLTAVNGQPGVYTFAASVQAAVSVTATLAGAPLPIDPQPAVLVLTGQVNLAAPGAPITASVTVDESITQPGPTALAPFVFNEPLCNGPLAVRVTLASTGVTIGVDADLVAGGTLLACGPADVGRQGGLAGADGSLDNNDFVVFIDAFFNSAPTADRGATGGVPGSDGQFDNNDFIVFIDQFFAGC